MYSLLFHSILFCPILGVSNGDLLLELSMSLPMMKFRNILKGVLVDIFVIFVFVLFTLWV